MDISDPLNITCIPCQAGFFASKEGLTTCEMCLPGTQSLAYSVFHLLRACWPVSFSTK